MTNIELKAKCHDLVAAEKLAKELGASFEWRNLQTDTYYVAAKGRLKFREHENGSTELISYNREDIDSSKRSDYFVYKTLNAEDLKRVLDFALTKKIVVEKTRTLYLWENVRIHLDNVNHLGTFIEFEAIVNDETNVASAQRKIAKLIKTFNISPTDIVATGYAELLLEQS